MRYIKTFLILLLFSTYSTAQVDKKDFFLNLSIDKNITSSQNAGTSAAFSAISGLAYLSSKYDLNKNFFYRLGSGYSAAMITLLNHELSGHGLRALEFNCKPDSLEIDPLSLSGSMYSVCTRPMHIQKDTIISLGGMQANYLLAQKISDNLFVHEQKIDPITGIGYILSAADQVEYNYINHNNKPGHDVNSYVEDIEIMYGNKSISRDITKSHGFLSFLDPILFASVYSAITGRNVNVPVLSIGNVGVMPFARSIFTPYGVIEKKFGAYIVTDYTPIKVGFSFGKQFKTREPKDLSQWSHKYSSSGKFAGLKGSEVIEEHMAYGFDISVLRLFTFNKLSIGASAAFWSQPELFVEDPYREKPKNGFLFTIDTSYEISKNINILCNIGYKSKGFIPGQYLDKTPIANLAFEHRI